MSMTASSMASGDSAGAGSADRRFPLSPKATSKFVWCPNRTCNNYPFREKTVAVLTVYRAKDFADAKRIVRDILEYQGKGHSCGIQPECRLRRETRRGLDFVRLLVNQAAHLGNGGRFNNGLSFTLRWVRQRGRATPSPRTSTALLRHITPPGQHHSEAQAAGEAELFVLLGQVRYVTCAGRVASTRLGPCCKPGRHGLRFVPTSSAGLTEPFATRSSARSRRFLRVLRRDLSLRASVSQLGKRAQRCGCIR